MKKVSVIIPTYKRSDSLVRAINSVLFQNYDNIEVIVVDDNDDNSIFRKENEEKMRNFQNNKKVIYLKHIKNKNGAAARNTGLKAATGDYITFLDDDDYFLPGRIEKLVNLLEKNKEYDCAYTAVVYFQNKKLIKKISAIKSGNLKLDLLKQKSFFGTGSNLFFRKQIINRIGLFDERFIRHQDIEYMIRFFDFGKVIPLNDILVVKCTDDKSNNPNFKKMLSVKKMFFKKFDKDIKFYSEESNDIYFENYIQLLYKSLDNKNNFKYVLDILKLYKKINIKIYIKCFYKKLLMQLPIIKKILYVLKPSCDKKIEKYILDYAQRLED